jgi:hypothetical protein
VNAACPSCNVATDCASDGMYCAPHCDVDATTLTLHSRKGKRRSVNCSDKEMGWVSQSSGDEVGLSQDKHSHSAQQVKECATRSTQGGETDQSLHRAMDCYATVQESRKWLTARAVLLLIVHVMRSTVLLPPIKIPPPYEGEDISASSQSSASLLNCYITQFKKLGVAHIACKVATDCASGEVYCGAPYNADPTSL